MNFIGSSGFPPFIAGVVNSSNDDGRNDQVPSLSCFGLVDSPEFPSVADNVKGKKRKGFTDFGASHSRSPVIKTQVTIDMCLLFNFSNDFPSVFMIESRG